MENPRPAPLALSADGPIDDPADDAADGPVDRPSGFDAGPADPAVPVDLADPAVLAEALADRPRGRPAPVPADEPAAAEDADLWDAEARWHGDESGWWDEGMPRWDDDGPGWSADGHGWDGENSWWEATDPFPSDIGDVGTPGPWFLGAPDQLLDEEEQDAAAWAAQFLAVPFVRRCLQLHAFVGEGRPVTDSGVLPNAAVRELKALAGITRPGGRLREIPELMGPWAVMRRVRLLAVHDGWVRPDAEGRIRWPLEDRSELFGVGAALAIGDLLDMHGRFCPGHGGTRRELNLLESVLAATSEGGIALPPIPADGRLDEVALAHLFAAIGANPRIRQLPVDEVARAVDIRALEELGETQRDLDLLVSHGVLRRRGAFLHGERSVRTAVATRLMRDGVEPSPCAVTGCEERAVRRG